MRERDSGEPLVGGSVAADQYAGDVARELERAVACVESRRCALAPEGCRPAGALFALRTEREQEAALREQVVRAHVPGVGFGLGLLAVRREVLRETRLDCHPSDFHLRLGLPPLLEPALDGSALAVVTRDASGSSGSPRRWRT